MSVKAIFPTALLVLTLGTCGALAQINPGPDVLGLYFDPEATITAQDVPLYTPFNLYLVVTNPTASLGISGWECRITNTSTGGLYFLSSTLAAGTNFLGTWDYFVPIGRPNALRSRPAVLLATIQCLMMDTSTVEFYLHPCSRPSVPGAMIYAADNDVGDFRILDWSSGAESAFVAVINPPSTTVVVDAEPDAVNAPWTLAGPGGFSVSANGDQSYPDVEAGTYTIAWNDVFGWVTPPPDTMTVGTGETITFRGTYLPGAVVIVDPDPDGIQAPWDIEGPGGYADSGAGDQTLGPLPVGTYALAWADVFGWRTPPPDTLTAASGDTVRFGGTYVPAGAITGITDVGNDQGGQVRIVFARSFFDAPGDTVDVGAYEVYRRQDAYKGLAVRGDHGKLLGWDYLATVPAHGEDYYQCIAPTLCDSTKADGVCWSVFFIRTVTPDPLVFFDSAPDSGYSLDNLEPNVPQDFQVAFAAAGNLLSWSENEEPDVRYYCVYRSETGAKVADPELVQKVVGTTWTDDLSGVPGHAWDYRYFVTAVDFAGNESDPTDWESTGVSGNAGDAAPRVCRLHPCYPNPFNPMVTIGFDLPDIRQASLKVYDVSGRLVATLVDGATLPAGTHQVVWTGTDDSGRAVAAGVYFYRLQAGDFQRTRTMTMVK
ncbi:MAG: FlgD immunoglobulin-like domain containing protein [Candidatus Krumholzibacteriia bacterium]